MAVAVTMGDATAGLGDPAPGTARGADVRQKALIAFLLLASLTLVLSPLLSRDLHGQDERLLLRLEQLDPAEEFTRPHYREPLPLSALFLRAQQKVAAPGTATPFVAMSLTLHAINVLLLLSLLGRSGAGTWATALVSGAFALHPVQVENVARVAAQGELLATGFVLAGLHLRNRTGLAAELGLLACLVAGAMCAPTALLLPILLVLLAPDPRRAAVARIPQLVAGGLLAILLWSRTVHELAVWSEMYGILDHLHHFASAILLSFTDLAAPYALSAMHVVPAPLAGWVSIVVLPLLVLALWAGARQTGTSRPTLLLGLALGFAAFRGVLRFEYRSDGWLAFAVVGLAWMFVARFRRSGRFPRAGAVLVLGLWAVMAHAQAGSWITERALLDRAIAVQPSNWEARTARAELAMLAGETETIEADAVAALVAQPRSVAAAFLLGYARGLAGDDDALVRLGTYGSRTGWNDQSAELRLGYLFLDIGLPREAATLLLRARSEEALPGLALASAHVGDPGAALAWRDQALDHELVSGEARLTLAWLLATAPEPELRDAERALALADQGDEEELRVLQLDARAAALAALGRHAEAYRDAQAAARHADAAGYRARANEIRARALVYLGAESWTEPRGSAPATDARVDEEGDEEDGRGRDPGDR